MKSTVQLRTLSIYLFAMLAMSSVLFAQSEDLIGRGKEQLRGKVRFIGINHVSVLENNGKYFEDVGSIVAKRSYDEKGRIVEQAEYNDQGIYRGKWSYAYEDSMRKVTAKSDIDQGFFPSSYDYWLNAIGKAAKSNGYNRNGVLTTITSYSYNELGKLAEEVLRLANGDVFMRNIYVYDRYGNEITHSYFNANGAAVFMETNGYDEKGNRITEKSYVEGTIDTLLQLKYDDYGNKLEEKSLAPNGNLQWWSTYSYEYDQVGNWIKQTTYDKKMQGSVVEFMPTLVTYRNIVYY